MRKPRTEKNLGFPKRIILKTANLDPVERETRIQKALDPLIDEALREEGERIRRERDRRKE